MLEKVRNIISASPLKVIPLFVAAVLLTSAVNVYIYKIENDRLQEFTAQIEEDHREESWNEISSLIKMANVASRQNSKFIAKKIEVDILREYTNMDILKSDFTNGEFNKGFHTILKSNLVNENGAPSALYPPAFYTLVGMEKGIIAMFSNEASATLSASSIDSIMEWDSYAQGRSNPTLAKTAINAVMARDSGLIFWQNVPDSDNEIQSLSAMTMETLRTVYEKKGIEGLGNFSIVSPSYITETGDIFQTDDTTLLKKNENYKLVILQSFNLLDILEKYEVDLAHSNSNNENNVRFIEDYIKYNFIKTLSSSLVLFLLSMFFVKLYNSTFTRKNEDS